ncbi:protein kinase [Serratia odorifera]|nr:protein kinase [Serratia odorifera]
MGRGSTADVYEDTKNPSFLYKKYDLIGNERKDVIKEAKQESKLFNIFYGADSSSTIQHGKDIYLRMLRVPGIPLSEIDTVDIPSNLDELYLKMICDMNELRIIHGDLNTGNMIYNTECNKLFPIDFKNVYSEYHSKNKNNKNNIDKQLQLRAADFYSLLHRKKMHSNL